MDDKMKNEGKLEKIEKVAEMKQSWKGGERDLKQRYNEPIDGDAWG